MADNDDRHYLIPSEAAKLLKVSPVTVRAWAHKGFLPSETTVGGHRRFLRGDIEQFAKNRETPPARRNLRILIIDCDKQSTSSLTKWLTAVDKSFIVNSAADGFEAGAKLHRFEPDIILLDLMMPKMDSFAVCRWIKTNPETRNILVIAMMDNPSPEHRQRIIDAGAEACISKPLDKAQLLDLLKAELL